MFPETVARWCWRRAGLRRLKMAASSSDAVGKDGMVAPKHQQLHQLNGFNRNGRSPATPFVIGVAGGTASGKSTVCQRIMEKLGQDNVDRRQRQVVCISQDSFYKELNDEDKAKAFKGMYNFDHPDAFDNELTVKILHDILNGQVVNIPVYDFKTNARHVDEHITIYPADVVLFEGILVFYFAEMRDLFHMKLFVDTDSDTRLSRRVLRDIKERDRDLEQIIYQYTTFVKPAFEEFCLPTKKYADVIIPRGADNTVAIDLIVQHIKDLLRSNRNCLANRLRHNSDSFVTRPH